jgi:hypothetical protein
MHVLFPIYHNFAATEMHVIRVFIAAYAWITGYGNYLYYAKTSDSAPDASGKRFGDSISW